ncbi:hypothetical protein HELRODRAFT_162930 [Helobdella robusta]|uniref:Uncharacterized protein n=1 Tax=Helobdella robusta TaxID=6412 RepID=T1ETD4_HELRO|nr:hypothetical protein HELRODRAFT_162930 [Helobdella robusta]ESN99383.1 hypothetical protein HELRODRAFT_162930 [Helobdella robusta]
MPNGGSTRKQGPDAEEVFSRYGISFFPSPTYPRAVAWEYVNCPVCSNHYKITPDGKLCRHGGRVKGQECSGSRKKVDAPQVVTGPPHVAASSDGLVMGAMTAVLKRVPLHDHIPKPCREKCSNALHELLTAVCCDSGDPAHWCRLFLFFPYVLQKPAKGGRRVTSLLSGFENHINANPRGHNPDRWINAVSSCIEQGNVSAAVLKAIKSFGNGSSRSHDGLRPQHLKDLLSGPLPIDDLLISLTKFINLVLSGACPPTEPSGISVQDGKRPDGCTLTSWRAGKCLAWDVTIPGTLAERLDADSIFVNDVVIPFCDKAKNLEILYKQELYIAKLLENMNVNYLASKPTSAPEYHTLEIVPPTKQTKQKHFIDNRVNNNNNFSSNNCDDNNGRCLLKRTDSPANESPNNDDCESTMFRVCVESSDAAKMKNPDVILQHIIIKEWRFNPIKTDDKNNNKHEE